MKSGETLSVWLSAEDRWRLEEASAIAGYKRLSTYVRDRALGQDERDGARARSEEARHRLEVQRRLADLETDQQAILGGLAMLLALAEKRSDAGDVVNAWARAVSAQDGLAKVAPELSKALAQFDSSWEGS